MSDLVSGGIFGACILFRFCLGGSVAHDEQSIVVDTTTLFVGFVGTIAKTIIIKEEWDEIDGFKRGALITNTALVLAADGVSVFADIMSEAEQPEIGEGGAVVALGLRLTGALVNIYEFYHEHQPSVEHEIT